MKSDLKSEANEILNNVFSNTNPNQDEIFLGISGVEFEVDNFDFGNGIILSKTFAYIFAPYLAAFKKPQSKGEPSPGPWKTVSGGQNRDINYELYIPMEFAKTEWFDRLNTAWWILSLLRLKSSSLILAPVSSNYSFSLIGELDLTPTFLTIEFNNNQILIQEHINKIISIDDLNWVKRNWQNAGMLYRNNIVFADSYIAIDSSVHEKRISVALIIIWGALERLFADFKQELNYRIALNISTYLEKLGDERLNLFKCVKKLYTARSKAAHGNPTEDYSEFYQSYCLLEKALIKIIEDNKVPSLQDIESLILCNK